MIFACRCCKGVKLKWQVHHFCVNWLLGLHSQCTHLQEKLKSFCRQSLPGITHLQKAFKEFLLDGYYKQVLHRRGVQVANVSRSDELIARTLLPSCSLLQKPSKGLERLETEEGGLLKWLASTLARQMQAITTIPFAPLPTSCQKPHDFSTILWQIQEESWNRDGHELRLMNHELGPLCKKLVCTFWI